MEHRSWNWKKRSTEKSIAADDKVNKGNEEVRVLMADKAELERDMKTLNEKLLSTLAESSAKDEIAKKQTKIAREAIAGWEKAEAEAIALKQELDKATQQRVAGEERLISLDSALKECMQQLRFVREEQEKRIHDAVLKTSREFEKARTSLEEKLAETNKRLAKLGSDNNQLSKALIAKEKMINDLHEVRTQMDENFSALMSRLETTERENASLKYEVRVLEKELEIRNEEREFNRRTAEVSHKQQLESIKKIGKLESENQRLRMLVRKRLPGPAALMKMKSEVETLNRDTSDTRRRRSNLSNTFPRAVMDFSVDVASDQRISFLTEQLCAMEVENRNLKENLGKKLTELQLSNVEPAKRLLTPHEHYMASSSDIASEEKVSVIESCTTSCKTVGASDIALMDDFVEMEKLAIVSVDKPLESSNRAPEKNHSDLSKSMLRLIELIEGISFPSKDYGTSLGLPGSGDDFQRHTETSSGYMVRVFQWKTAELSAVLQKFLQNCTNLLIGKADMHDFARELTSALEWIMNHCFSLQDVSSMRYEMKKHFDWDETRSENEEGLSIISAYNVHHNVVQMLEPAQSPRDESQSLKDKLASMELAKKDLEERLQSEICKSESLNIQLQESGTTIGSLRAEVELLKERKEMMQVQAENSIVEKNLNKQLTIHKSTSPDELESKSSCNKKLEPLSVDQSIIVKDNQKSDPDQCDKQLQTELEITAASEKLAECQETILNLGKQLKALASPREAPIFDKVMSTPTRAAPSTPTLFDVICTSDAVSDNSDANKSSQRSSLLDKMMAEDNSEAEDLKSPKTKDIICTSTSPSVTFGKAFPALSPQRFISVNGIKHQEEEEALVNFLSIVPSKKKSSGGLLKRLWRRRDNNSKKATFPVAVK